METSNAMLKYWKFSFHSFILFLSLVFISFLEGCSNDDVKIADVNFKQDKLVADIGSYGAARTDSKLTNPWGIAIGPTGALWIADNHSGYTSIYDRNGVELAAAIPVAGGAPTGVVYNENSGEFLGAKYIYATEEGMISTWSSGTSSGVAVDRSSMGAIYKGLAIATDGDERYLYVANFGQNNIDVYDINFDLVTSKAFDDPSIPAGYAPFNIYTHDDKLFVAYAKVGADHEDDEAGSGNGYVNVFNPDGTLDRRFASRGTLNSPWAIVDAPSGFGLGDEIFLVSNFGDGRINVYNEDGEYKGQLMDNGQVISIEGLWGLAFPEDGVPVGDQNQLFFTAGPADEVHGVFGTLTKR